MAVFQDPPSALPLLYIVRLSPRDTAPVEQLRVRVAPVEDKELLSGAIVPASNDVETSPHSTSVPGTDGTSTRFGLKLYHL